ncbi:hypothetical protein [Candidatus Thioglobus sp.]|uniref:hypothetical protein n=1 Tax=Candidatus Thioglobus sp. TaxID=2026721 RepID=UPI003D0BE37E
MMDKKDKAETMNCPICGGDGKQTVNSQEYDCKRCAGTGKVKEKKKTCGPCKGTGKEVYFGVSRSCPYCKGKGWKGNW